MFSSLKVRNFRIYWIGMFISLLGSWIQNVAQSWLVFELTGSAFYLGLVGFLGALPVSFLTLFGGAMADRVNKRNVLLITQTVFMLLAFTLAVLTQLKLISVWQIMVIAVLNGMVMAFDGPSRQSVVVEMVGKGSLMNAIALNSAAFNSARIIGPAIAAILVATIGMSGCFYLNGVSFLAVIIALFLVSIEPVKQASGQGHVIKDILEGLHFVRHNRVILLLVSFVGISSLFGISYIVLMPLFAKNILHSGVSGLGLLMSSSGVGALVAALVLAHLGNFKAKGMLLLVSMGIFPVSLILFSFSKVLLLSMVCLVFVGWSSVIAVSLVNNLLQELVPDRFRGRVMSVFMFTFAGILPFGNLIAGSLAQVFGPSFAVMTGGIVCGIFFTGVHVFFPEIRKL